MDVTTTKVSAMLDVLVIGNSSNTTHYSSFAYKVMVPAIWSIIVCIGVLGNIIVIFTMVKHSRRTARSATSNYIINVAVTDLAFLMIVVPITTSAFVSESWDSGETFCKFSQYVTYVTLLSTCLTLTAMTIDRYFAIVHPIKSIKLRTPKLATITCVMIWLVSCLVCSPYIIFHEVRQANGTNVLNCMMTIPNQAQKVLTVVVVLVTYVVPLMVIIVCYSLILRHLWLHKIFANRDCNKNSECNEPMMCGATALARRRKKASKMVAVVVILYAITWLPIHLFNLVYVLMDESFPKNKPLYDLKIFAHTLSYTSSCVNPFVYTIMGDSFRKAFRESLTICRGSPTRYKRPSYPRRSGSTVETRFNGE